MEEEPKQDDRRYLSTKMADGDEVRIRVNRENSKLRVRLDVPEDAIIERVPRAGAK